MENKRFKELLETNRADLFNLCYIYYLEEAKGNKCDRDMFNDLFNMWLFSRGGIGNVINYLKQKHQL